MKDEYSYTPKELLSQIWDNVALALQVQHSLWSAVISLNAITISALAIISNIYTSVNIWLVIVPIFFPFISVFLLILNFREVYNVSACAHSGMLNSIQDEDGHIYNRGQDSTDQKSITEIRKKIIIRFIIKILIKN